MKLTIFALSISLFSFATLAGECDFKQQNICVSCDTPDVFEVANAETCTYICPNRKAIHRDRQYYCVLKECPKEQPFASDYGKCFAQKEEAQDDAPEAWRDILYEVEETSLPAINEKCPKEMPLLSWNDRCFSCDNPYPIRLPSFCNIDEDEEQPVCDDACPNRTLLYWAGGNIPSVPNCPKDKPLMDRTGICFACDTPISVGVMWNNRLCQKACSNRYIAGQDCVLNENK